MLYYQDNINHNKDIISDFNKEKIDEMIKKRNELIIQRNTLDREITYLNLLIGDNESG